VYEAIVGTAVVLAASLTSFLVGLVVGLARGGAAVKDWLDQHGCYSCQQSYRDGLPR